jgi:predicted ATPase
MIALCAERQFTEALNWASTLHGWAMAEQGRHEEGIAQMKEGLALLHATRTEMLRPYLLCLLAKACAKAGRLEDGLDALTEALTAADERENRTYEAEAYRLKGELLLKQGGSSSAQAQKYLRHAIEVARKQSAKSFELRATMSLARLLAKQGRQDEAHSLMTEVYNWFTEGVDTPDLKDAKALMDALAAA